MQYVLLGGDHGIDRVALFDDEYADVVRSHVWHAVRGRHTYYAATNTTLSDGSTRILFMHQLIMGNIPEGKIIDHVNGFGLDNQSANLRIGTRGENNYNRRARSGTKSQYKGVAWNSRARKWEVRIMANGVQHYLGVFTDESEAARAYDRAAIQYHGEWARLNFPREQYP